MSLAYEISPSGDQVRVVGNGPITTAECIGLVKALMADPHRCPCATVLVDLRDATYAPDRLDKVIHIGKVLEMFRPSLKNHVAIVARRSILFPAEILATYIRKTTHAVIRVFVDVAAAEAFLRFKFHGGRATRGR